MAHCPMKFRYVRGKLASPALRILDIGCGNGSPTVTKRWFPGCHYAGADIQRYRLSDADVAAMDEFFQLAADGSGYDTIPDASYDFVILNHVIEHMAEPAPIVAALCASSSRGIHLDRVSFRTKPHAAALGRRNAELLRRSDACLLAESIRDCRYSVGKWSECSAQGPFARRFLDHGRRCIQALQAIGEEALHRKILRAWDVVFAWI